MMAMIHKARFVAQTEHDDRTEQQLYSGKAESPSHGDCQSENFQQTYDPYVRRDDDRFHLDRRGNRGGGGGGNHRDGGGKPRSGWYKVTIPHGKKYEKRWLLTALQNICSVSYTPVQYHVDHNKVHFYVDDSLTASALHKCSHKITDSDGYKVKVYVNPSAPPLKPEDSEHLKHRVNRKKVHFNIDGSTTASALQKRPRKTKGSDGSRGGKDLPPPIGVKVKKPIIIPKCKDNIVCTDEVKDFILRFLQLYYSIYDSGDRQPLLNAYHDGASFSFTMQYSTQNPSRSSMDEDHKDNQNRKHTKDGTMYHQQLKHERQNVVAFLNKLPRTQHNMASFTVDVNTCRNTLLSFTVRGIFKEAAVDGKSQESTMVFGRVFITVLTGNSGVRIVNDQLCVRMATTEEILRAFEVPVPIPTSIAVPTLTPQQQMMLMVFSQKSGMNLEWSQMCLQDNEWDFIRAAQIFTQLKAEGKIPDEALDNIVCTDEVKDFILRFLQLYYSIYDSGDRQPLLDAYHDGALFSFTMQYSTQNPSRSSLDEDHKDNQNLTDTEDSTMYHQELKHERLNVVAFLNNLPRTQHNMASFTVDVNTCRNTLLSFTVRGIFKEVAVDGKSQESTMVFGRVFITVPAGNSGMCIINDQLCVRMATTEEILRAFEVPVVTMFL